MMDIISIVNDINCGLLTKLNAVSKILAKLNDDMDPIVIRLLLCVKPMIETLPSDSQKKAVLEFRVSTRYLQPLFQALFGDDDICSSGRTKLVSTMQTTISKIVLMDASKTMISRSVTWR